MVNIPQTSRSIDQARYRVDEWNTDWSDPRRRHQPVVGEFVEKT